jgi:hypothetical protein
VLRDADAYARRHSEAGGRRLFFPLAGARSQGARPEAGAAVLKYMQVRRVRASPHRWALPLRGRR